MRSLKTGVLLTRPWGPEGEQGGCSKVSGLQSHYNTLGLQRVTGPKHLPQKDTGRQSSSGCWFIPHLLA